MRITIDEQYKSFEWNFLFHGKNYTFKEQFTGKFWDSSQYHGFGEILANLMWINSIANPEDNQFKKNDDFSPILKLNFLGISYENNNHNFSVIFYEALAKLAFVIYNQAAYCIQYIRDAKYRSSNKFEAISSFVCKSLDYSKENTDYHDPDIYMKFLFSGLGEIQKLFNKNNNFNSQEIINSLADIIRRYSTNSKLIPRYQFERNDKDSGCVAAYLFSQPQSNENQTLKGYLAFSGYNDCEDKSLFKAIKSNSKNYAFPTEFIEKLHEIAAQLQLKLVTTNESICLCVENTSGQIQINTTLGMEICLGKNNSDFKNAFACCERKIFTEFYENDITPPAPKFGYYAGTLHVKFPPCELCKLSIQHEHSKSHNFDVICYIQQL
jgi:hypothetical protein